MWSPVALQNLKTVLLLTPIVFLLWSPSKVESFATSQSDLYQQGIARRDSGNWRQALEIWLAARDLLKAQNTVDPRIGLAFIELVTQKEAEEYYQRASDMYLWGFSQDSRFKEEALQEVDRIMPLLSEKEQSEWRQLTADSTIIMKIRTFWAIKDPLPTTETNERLVEHWLRIAHAKENFKNDKSTVYGTDDRGQVFVKYGEPDKKFAGKLGADQFEVMRWFEDFLLRQEIQRYNNTPEVEIWVYVGLKKDGPAVFLFGKKSGFGKYGLRYGVEDFIPERAFRRISTRTTRSVIPGSMIQLMYYSELFHIDHYFLSRFRKLEALWGNARAAGQLSPDRDVLLGLLAQYKNLDQNTVKFKYLPSDRSNTYEGLDLVDLNYKTFRYLDDQHQSKISIMAASSDRGADEGIRPVFFRAAKKTKHEFRHILLGYDQNWDLRNRIADYPFLRNSNTSTFVLGQGEPEIKYKLAAEKIIWHVREAGLVATVIADSVEVIGIGSAFPGGFAGLLSDSMKLEASDLIVGVRTPPKIEQSIDHPFPVIPRDPLTNSDSLLVYLEVYHIPLKANLGTALRFDYELKLIKEDGKVDIKKAGPSKSVDVEVSAKKLKKTFAMDISKLASGYYELTVKVTERKSKQEKIRKSTFRIID
jgi:GWxTD domain-containing protein